MPLIIQGQIHPKIKELCIKEIGHLFMQSGYEPKICYEEKRKLERGETCRLEDADFWLLAQKSAEQVASEFNQTNNFILYWED